jgi:hypothetical protein
MPRKSLSIRSPSHSATRCAARLSAVVLVAARLLIPTHLLTQSPQAPKAATQANAASPPPAPALAPASDRADDNYAMRIPSIAGFPFSATAVTESTSDLYDDDDPTFRTIALMARDARGRTHNEIRRLMPESFHGSPQVLEIRLYDPETHIRTLVDPSHRIARQQLLPVELGPAPLPPTFPVQVKDLGTTTMNGFNAKGIHRTITVPKSESGTGGSIRIDREEWYSDDLHMYLLMHSSDPRVGTLTIGISNLKRAEPPASMFQIPPGYKTVQVPAVSATPQAPAPAAHP